MVSVYEAAATGFDRGLQQSRSNKAYAAARAQYGDMAGDPGLFSALQGIDITKAREQRAVSQEQRDVSQEQRTQSKFEVDQQDDDAARQRKAVLGLVNGLRSARDRDEDIGEAFDKISGTLRALNVNPEDIPAMRQAVVDNPAILDDYLAALTEVKGSSAGASGGGAGASGVGTAALERASNDIFNRIDILEGTSVPEKDRGEFEKVQESIFGLPSLSGMRTGGFGQYASVPGSRAADYNANFEALSSDVRSAAFETLKKGGQITEAESQFAADAIAKLTRAVSPGEYRRELKRLRAYMGNLMGVASRRLAGEEIPDQLEYPPEVANEDMSELARRILADPDAPPEDKQWAESIAGGQ